MGLRSLYLKKAYSSESDDILHDFYIPVLQSSIEYSRLTGFFSSRSLAIAARGISSLILNGGTMKLIVSPILNKKDLEVIMNASETPEKYIEKKMLEELGKLENEFVRNHVKALGWLIANKKLEIKIAVAYNKKGKFLSYEEIQQEGLFHQKVGILRDLNGNVVTFSGSVNETAMGWLGNIEEFKVFRNWELTEREYVEADILRFEKFWKDQSQRIKIMDIPQVVKKKLIEIAPSDLSELDLEYQFNKKNPLIPLNIELREYQKKAIDIWFEKNGKGIFEMATGSGKTITALALVSELYEKLNKRLAVIITCPYKHLVMQWKNAAKNFNLSPILGFESHNKWEKDLNSKITSFNIGAIDCFSLVTTHTTFGMKIMQKSLAKLNGENAVLVIDEVHHFGAEHLRNCLLYNINYRLGLSATPEDWYDNSRNEYINEYFEEGIIFQYELKDAIRDGWLTKYYYYPHLVRLTEEECDLYYEISKKIARILVRETDKYGFELSENPYLRNLLFKRARLIGSARNKLSKLKELLKEKSDSRFNLIYCGDGKIEDKRQIERVIKILGKELKMKVHPFTAHENRKIRRKLLECFENGELQGLVAIRCLDEGIDVPATQTAYILASSSNPRQYIQRRGRILRNHKDKKLSYIHDFIVIPPTIDQVDLLDPYQFNIERRMIMKELKRVSWFADTAENGPQARKQLLDIKKQYSLLHL